jgi:hypothetical protein
MTSPNLSIEYIIAQKRAFCKFQPNLDIVTPITWHSWNMDTSYLSFNGGGTISGVSASELRVSEHIAWIEKKHTKDQ